MAAGRDVAEDAFSANRVADLRRGGLGRGGWVTCGEAHASEQDERCAGVHGDALVADAPTLRRSRQAVVKRAREPNVWSHRAPCRALLRMWSYPWV